MLFSSADADTHIHNALHRCVYSPMCIHIRIDTSVTFCAYRHEKDRNEVTDANNIMPKNGRV